MEEIFTDSLEAMKITIIQYVEGGMDVPPAAFIFSKDSPMGLPLPVEMFTSKDTMAKALRMTCEMMDAWGLIQVSEVWALPLDGLDDKAAEARANEWAGRVHTHPDRVEQVMIIWEYKQEQGMMMATIVLKDGKRALGEWTDSRETKGAKITGRMTSLLPGARGN